MTACELCMSANTTASTLRFEAEEKPPPLSALILGVQSAALVVAPIALFPIILVQAVGGTAPEIAWAAFAMLVVNGAATILQAFRIGPMGSGLFIITYPSPSAIPFCIIALVEGGAGTLASLVLVTGLFQILVSMRLSLLRRVVTPAFSGAILILLVITVVPVVFRSLNDVPDGAHEAAGPVCILVSFVLLASLLIRGSVTWRVWSSVIGIAAGAVAGVAFGIFDFDPVREAPIVGMPLDGWNGIGLSFGVAFWSLLPAFLFLAVIGVLQGTSIALSSQRVSWRGSRAIDYRRVQGVSICTGLGNLLAGITAVMPIATSPRGTVFTQQTGCASRHIGIITGVILIAAAFFPKSWGLLVGIPAPVTGVFLVFMLSPLVVEGMKMIVQDSPDYGTAIAIGAAILVGTGMQTGFLSLPVGDLWESIFQRALTAGAVTLVVLMLVSEFRKRKLWRLRTEASMEALPRINGFLEEFARGNGWEAQMTERLRAVAEETLGIMAEPGEDAGEPKRLLVSASGHGSTAELEFVGAAGNTENLEDQLTLLDTPAPESLEVDMGGAGDFVERDTSLRLLRHYATTVTHRQYHDIEIVSVRVTSPSRQ